MVVSSVVGLFEQVVSQLTLIMCFQSLILDMAGNVGTQSLAVTIRVLMDESLYRKAEAGTGMEGNAHCLLKWSDPWRTFFHSHLAYTLWSQKESLLHSPMLYPAVSELRYF